MRKHKIIFGICCVIIVAWGLVFSSPLGDQIIAHAGAYTASY